MLDPAGIDWLAQPGPTGWPSRGRRTVRQPLLAVLASCLRDGSALLSPVWHEWADGGFSVCIPEADRKLAQLRRDPRVSIVVADNKPPYRGIEVRAAASLTAEPFAATMRRLAHRYLGPGGDDLIRIRRPASSSGSSPGGCAAGTSRMTWLRFRAPTGDSSGLAIETRGGNPALGERPAAV